MASWIDALAPRSGPLCEAASRFAAVHGVERDPPRGREALRLLARRLASFDPERAAHDDERALVEGAGAFLALLLLDRFPDAEHRDHDGVHRLHLGGHGSFDPFASIERVLAADMRGHALLAEVQAAEAASPAAGFEALRAHLFPRLVGERFTRGLPAETRAGLQLRPLAHDVHVALIVRYADRARYVTRAERLSWSDAGIDAGGEALRNLARTSEHLRLYRGDSALVVARSRDGHDAARILLPAFAALLAAELGAPFVVGLPHRDTLLACARSASLVERLQRLVDEAALRAPHAITRRLLLVDAHAGISELPAAS